MLIRESRKEHQRGRVRLWRVGEGGERERERGREREREREGGRESEGGRKRE